MWGQGLRHSVRWLADTGAFWLLDNAFAKIHSSEALLRVGGRGKMWSGGWGDQRVYENLTAVHRRRFESRGTQYGVCEDLARIEWVRRRPLVLPNGEGYQMEGMFPSPVSQDPLSGLPEESIKARVHLLVPPDVAVPGDGDFVLGQGAPCWVWLAGTGEEGFAMRRRMSMPLVAEGMAVMMLESPFYGSRRPQGQRGPKLRCVYDLLALGNATIEEALFLLAWLRRHGFGPTGVCGFSMGGVHSIMSCSVAERELALVSLLSPCCASHVYTQGALAAAVDWQALAQAHAYEHQGARFEVMGRLSGEGPGGADREERSFALERMREVLGVTNVTQLQPPVSKHAAVLVQAEQDAYVNSSSAQEVVRAWGGGGEIRWVKGGHVSAFFTEHEAFRDAMRDAMRKLAKGREEGGGGTPPA